MKEKLHVGSPSQIINNLKIFGFLILFLFGTNGFVEAQNQNANSNGSENAHENATVYGGEITFADDEIYTELCVGDDVPDMVEVKLENASGRVKQWIITDDENNILGLPANPSEVDFDGAGEGTCRIWHLSYNGIKPLVDPFWHKHVKNLSDLKGKYHLSNYIEVKRIQQPEGGDISLADGSTEIEICAGDGISDLFDVTLTGASGGQGVQMLWVITDNSDMNKILGTSTSNSFDLEGAGGGVCLIWNLSYAENVDLTGLEYATDLTGCFDLSNPITVIRNGVNAGDIEITDGTTEIEICAGDGNSDAFDVNIVGDTEGTWFAWVITNNADDPEILGLPDSPPFDLEGAGEGTCLIWRIAYEDGLEGMAIGNSVSDLVGCYNLSNAITVIRNGVNAGDIEIADGTTEIEICAGDGNSDAFDVNIVGDTEGTWFAWVITNNADDPEILGLPDGPPFDLEGAGEGTCLIWRIAFEDDLEGVAVGNKVSDLSGCYNLSNSIIVIRKGVAGGTITGGTDNSFSFTVGDGTADKIAANAITLTENVGAKSQWVVTNADGTIILGLPEDYADVDFDGAVAGTCLVYHLSYEEGLHGLVPPTEGDHLVSGLSGCFSFSNSISVVRTAASSSRISIFPNPTKSSVKIDFTNFESDQVNIKVLNMNNVPLYNQDYNSRSNELNKTTTLNVSRYETGIYFVSITDRKTGETAVKRLVVN